jgi:alkylation response protein AidB-like acyl-CoA dehydrogenase
MHFALTEDQIAVRDMARDFAAEKIAPHAAASISAMTSAARR